MMPCMRCSSIGRRWAARQWHRKNGAGVWCRSLVQRVFQLAHDCGYLWAAWREGSKGNLVHGIRGQVNVRREALFGLSALPVRSRDAGGPFQSAKALPLRTHIPVQCPFKLGEKSFGRLCWPPQAHRVECGVFWACDRQVDGERAKLPSLTFQLEESREPGDSGSWRCSGEIDC